MTNLFQGAKKGRLIYSSHGEPAFEGFYHIRPFASSTSASEDRAWWDEASRRQHPTSPDHTHHLIR